MKAELIEIPFVMPEPDPVPVPYRRNGGRPCGNRKGRLPVQKPASRIIQCVGALEGQPILEIGAMVRTNPIVGAYRHKSGMLVIVSETYGMEEICDVLVPQEETMYFAGYMKPTPSKRFHSCPIGKKWYYHREPMERISMNSLASIICKYAPGGLPMMIREYGDTDLAEAFR